MEKVEDNLKQPYFITVVSIFTSAFSEALHFTKQTDTFKRVCTKVEETKSHIYGNFPVFIVKSIEAILKGKEIATKAINKAEKIFYKKFPPEVRAHYLGVGYSAIGTVKKFLIKGQSYLIQAIQTESESDSPDSDSDDSKREMSHLDILEGNLTDYNSEEDSDYVPPVERESDVDSLEFLASSEEDPEELNELNSENDEITVEIARRIFGERERALKEGTPSK
ncbi:UNVERIFIED_CONTAM: hypothetical protein RMT77_002512 [Armadillidium vulgare]